MRERKEDDRLDTTFKLNVKGTTNFGVQLSLIGRITSEAGPDTGQSLLHAQLKSHCTVVATVHIGIAIVYGVPIAN